MIVDDFIQLVEERGMTHKYHEERFKDAIGTDRIAGLVVSCGQESTFFTWGLIRNQEQDLLEDLARLEEKGTPKDYEAPRAEYPFRAPPEPTALTQLYDADNSFSEKREFVRRCIESGIGNFRNFWSGKSIVDLAKEVGLWEYYQSKQEGTK